jgi:protocatechuate 3,4-dioxygenase beta subunit
VTPLPTATPTPSPTPTAAPASHVGDLDGSATPASGGKWNATITIRVEDAAHNPVANATVSGTWSAGASGSGSCVTNASGLCAITKNNINKNSASVTFTVTGVSHGSYTYASGSNHDPDGDRTGTVIVVNKP